MVTSEPGPTLWSSTVPLGGQLGVVKSRFNRSDGVVTILCLPEPPLCC